MKANLKNALMIVAALLVVYVGAFFATMKVKPIMLPAPKIWWVGGRHVPRWGTDPGEYLDHWTVKFFAPLIWVEHQILPPEYWEWNEGQPVPDWVK